MVVGKLRLLFLVIIILLCSGCSVDINRSLGNHGNLGEVENSYIQDKLYVSSWLRTGTVFDVARKDSFIKNIVLFNEINPVWYEVTQLNWANIAYDQQLVKIAQTNGVKVLPTIQNVAVNGAQVVNNIISDDILREAHIRDIVELVITNGFDGIDIDYENDGTTKITNNDEVFTKFICRLGEELSSKNKLLSVCVYSKDSGVLWQDWPKLLNGVDTLKVMLYNCDITPNPVPAPISPLKSLRNNLNYMRKVTQAKGKIIIGLPFYGRDWLKKETGYFKTSLLYKKAQDLMTQYAITSEQVYRNDGEPYFKYQDSSNGEHIVYFQDHIALRERLNLINQYRDVVKGVTFWDLGGEDPLSWDEIAKYK